MCIRDRMLDHAASEVDFDGKEVYIINPDGADNGAVSVSLSDIATKAQVNNTIPVDAVSYTHLINKYDMRQKQGHKEKEKK